MEDASGRLACGFAIAMALCFSGVSGAEGLALARPFGSRMVLPMERPVPVWGRAEPGEKVRVSFGGNEVSGIAGADGGWRVMMPAMAASADGRRMTIRTEGGDEVAVDDVLVGRVLLCSGQSNMDFPLNRAIGGREEAAQAGKHTGIRLMNLTGAPTSDAEYGEKVLARLNEEDHFVGGWSASRPESAGAFSAIGWWTGRALHEACKVPVGLVENAVGGSGAEAWLPRECLAALSDEVTWEEGGWLDSDRIAPWARTRAKRNLGRHTMANHPFRPGFLYESGFRWWRDFPFDGVLWYQGETNAELEDDVWNERLIRDLVEGWRKSSGLEDLRFVMVQLPHIGGKDPLRKGWPRFREVQSRAVARLSGVSLVVTKDLGWDSPDVHPPDKKPVADRVAAVVLKEWLR